MSNLERRLRRLEEHHGACNHRNDRGFLKPLLNPTQQDVERLRKELAECSSCRKRGGPLQVLIIECPNPDDPETWPQAQLEPGAEKQSGQ